MAGNVEAQLLSESEFKAKLYNTLQKKGILNSLKASNLIQLHTISDKFIIITESVEVCDGEGTSVTIDHAPCN